MPIIDYVRKTVFPLILVFLVMLLVNKGIRLLVEPMPDLTGLVSAFLLSALIGLFLVGVIVLNKQERQELLMKLTFWRPTFD